MKRPINYLLALGVSGILIFVLALPTSANLTFTWMNRLTVPNGTIYVDSAESGGQSTNFSRTGVSASLAGSGPTWSTRVWFGSYTTSGTNSASISGPRSHMNTKASFKFMAGNVDHRDTIRTRAWLTGAKMVGTMSEPDIPGALISPDSYLDSPVAGEIGESSQRIAEYGEFVFWSDTADDRVCLTVEYDHHAFRTCSPTEEFAVRGISQALEGPGGLTLQTIVLPPETVVSEELSQLGFEQLSASVYVNNAEQVAGSIRVEGSDAQDLLLQTTGSK